ncbi:MAG: hypothetical protein IJD38_05435, partial [Clostridia bacterium]|nr:hypothetical protein [Clostridia bacterium]
MKTTATKLLCLILAGLLLISSLVACGDQIETPEGETTSGSIQESETLDENQVALDELKEALGDVGDWGGEDFVVLYNAAFKNEVYGENGTVDQDG